MIHVFEKHLQLFKIKLDQLAANGQSFDVYHESGRIIFETFLEAAFEYTIEPNSYEDITSIVEDLKSMARREAKKPLRFMLNYFFPAFAKRTDPAIRVFAYKILQRYRENPNKSTANTIIRAIVDNDQFKNDTERVDEIMLFMVAGFDTTGTTLSSVLVLFAQNPGIANKLSEELVKVSENERCNLPLFDYVLKESFRMMPITAASLVRQTGKDITLKSGGIIPQGAICLMSPFVFGRNDKVFTDPECFNPDRWVNPTLPMTESLLPFGFGVRNCIGQTLAKAELNRIIPALIAEYEFSAQGEAEIDCAIFLQFTNTKLLVKKRCRRDTNQNSM